MILQLGEETENLKSIKSTNGKKFDKLVTKCLSHHYNLFVDNIDSANFSLNSVSPSSIRPGSHMASEFQIHNRLRSGKRDEPSPRYILPTGSEVNNPSQNISVKLN